MIKLVKRLHKTTKQPYVVSEAKVQIGHVVTSNMLAIAALNLATNKNIPVAKVSRTAISQEVREILEYYGQSFFDNYSEDYGVSNKEIAKTEKIVLAKWEIN